MKVESTKDVSRRAMVAGMLVLAATPVEALVNMIGVRGAREAVAGETCNCKEVATHVRLDKISISKWEKGGGYLPGDVVLKDGKWYVLACHSHCEPGVCKFWFEMPEMHPVTLRFGTYELNERHEITLSFVVEK